MRITDVRTGRLTHISPARPGLLRIWVHPSPAGAPFGLADLRALLVADVLFRLAEFNGLQAVVGCADGDHPQEEVKTLAQEAYRLGVHPPAAHSGPRTTGDLETALDGPCDLHVVAHAATLGDASDAPVVMCGPTAGPAPGPGGFLDAAGEDPLTVRLALLEHPYAQRAKLDGKALAEASWRLRHWRQRVAAWAETPSRPSHPDIVRAAFTAFAEGLDTPAALAALDRLDAESGVADGTRFETFVYVDRILGLELPRDIGRSSSS